MSTFQTEIKAVNGQNIYAIGDIHGDIRALIICLRDCCRVIKKKSEFEFSQKEIDKNMLKLINLKTIDSPYVQDLNYEWCGGNSIVVTLGDLIHPARGSYVKNEYPYEELKIYLFLNAIHEQAINQGGKIIKLLGNHEFVDIVDNYDGIRNYYGNNCRTPETQYLDLIHNSTVIKRPKLFKVGNYGCEVISKYGVGILVKINDFVFNHAGGITFGSLTGNDTVYFFNTSETKRLDYVYTIDQFKCLNDYINKFFSSGAMPIMGKFDKKTILQYIHDTIASRFESYLEKRASGDLDDTKCKRLNNVFEKFCKTCDPQNLKLVYGHTMQKPFLYDELYYYLDNQVRHDDLGIVTIKPTTLSKHKGKDNYHHSITLDCFDNLDATTNEPQTNGNSKPRIFRLDVSMSSGFDTGVFFKTPPPSFVEKLQSIKMRCPQILHVWYTNVDSHEFDYEIIRSTLKNTLIHQHRHTFNTKEIKEKTAISGISEIFTNDEMKSILDYLGSGVPHIDINDTDKDK